MAVTLALDLARKTGYATEHESGVVDFGFMPEETLGSKLDRFQQWLYEWTPLEPTKVICERSHHRGGAATRQAIGMEGLVELFAHEVEADLEFVHTRTLKKHATGNGAAKKPEMIAAAIEKWPEIEIEDDNHADALWLLDYEKNGK